MQVPYGWLQEYVPVPFPAADIAGRLTMAGFEVEEIHVVDGENVLDTHVNANRGDALSMLGIAREVAALTDNHLTTPVVAAREEGPDIHAGQRGGGSARPVPALRGARYPGRHHRSLAGMGATPPDRGGHSPHQ